MGWRETAGGGGEGPERAGVVESDQVWGTGSVGLRLVGGGGGESV